MRSLSKSQKNIYLNDLSGAKLPVNTLHTTLQFLEKTDDLLLEKAVNFVILNNDIFKIRIIDQGGEPFQDFCAEIKECNIDSTLYSDEELSVIFLQRKTQKFDVYKTLYDFTLYRKKNGLCVLSIVTHHIIVDGYGMGVLCDDILRVYCLLLEGRILVAETLPFADSLQVTEIDYEENKAFWNRYFDGFDIGGKPFATKNDSLIASVFKGAIESTTIMKYCAKHSLTPYTVFTAALGIYLMNIYGTDETVVIIPRMNRSLNERKTIGCFVLPVPIRFKKTDSFAALCEQISREGKVVSAHKKYDFSQIIEDFKRKFNTESPISEFTLNFQLKDTISKIKTKMNFSACGAMRNLITLNISNYEGDNVYDITYDYRSDILDEKYMAFFHNALKWIIKQGVSGTPVSKIKIIPDAELEYLKNEFRGETVYYNNHETIISLFEKTVSTTPYAPAVFTRDREVPLTFSELDNLSHKIAVSLRKKGAEKGSLVGFLLERNYTLLPTILGILKAGCGFLPLDINYPKGRIDYIISDSKAKFIISAPKIAQKFAIDYIDVNELLLGGINGSVHVKVNQDDLAYCIYTSGTTGQPKGALLAHKGIVNITHPLNNPFNKAVCAVGTGIVAIGSICFDISLFEILVFLLNGKFVAIANDDELANGEAIAELFYKTGANALHCTPSRLHNYLLGSLFTDVLKTQIKIILSAGEVLPSHLAAMIIDYNIKIYNGYGPTETTIGATITEAGDRETIGKPIANTAVYIVDAKKTLLPFGVTGEIAIAGDGVGLGYMGNDKLTAEKFTVINNERVYLTGDLGHFTSDGQLKYMTRNDSQVKLRGYRIELAEIEQCALQCQGVENCAVIMKKINDINYLILYYSGIEAVSEKLKEHLRKFLSYYMVPQVVVRLSFLPTNINGKTDRAALLKLSVAMKNEYAPPSTKEEKILCKAFEIALSLPRVGINDNFFEIGGTSLSAVKMMMYANKYDLSVEYSTIFKYPTPHLLAENMLESKIQNYLLPLVTANEKEFEKIDELLQQKHNENFSISALCNVLVTGATGFLGSHIIKYLLGDSCTGKIYCLVRAKGKLTPEKRLKTTLFYYFNDFFEEQFARKIKVIGGDMSQDNLFASIPYEINTAINCAANVAHFAYGDALESVNIKAVENLIDFCTIKNAELIHISTISVAGHTIKDNINDTVYSEHDLYKGQIISNEYIYSKFAAEFLVLKAKTKGLKVKVIRVGNLQGRMDDGEFQINLQKNAFMRSIKAYAAIGGAPDAFKNNSVNITPVDEAAKAILLLSGLPNCFTVFHVMNAVPVSYDQIFFMFSTIGKEIHYMKNEEFEELIDQLYKDNAQSRKVEGLFLEKSDIRLREIPIKSDFTVRTLKNLNFQFKTIEKDYIEKYLCMLNGLGFFD
ncbi:MAG: amino acid adenylation domain-containing protein [Firmicutes bacterium]|nr:amino acid adenylation domain-containing protein [Bacillota bacterium]